MTSEHGNVTIIVAVMLTVLLGAGAIVVDVGAMYAQASRLQTGADAAAVAVADACTDLLVNAPAAVCDEAMADQLTNDYLAANAGGSFSVLPPQLAHLTSRAGTITIRAQSTVAPAFAGVLGVQSHSIGATATARWGPVLEQSVFPLAICRGALGGPGGPVTIDSYPSGIDPPLTCAGAPTAHPLGWVQPSAGSGCDVPVSVAPATWLDIAPSDSSPAECDQMIDELLNALADPTSSSEERTRVLPVFDASTGVASHPTYSLIAFEFTGARVGDQEQHRDESWQGRCAQFTAPYLIDQLQCVRGEVRNWKPPEQSSVAGSTALGLPGVGDSTVLGIRLVD